MTIKHCERCHSQIDSEGFHYHMTECVKQEIIDLTAQLRAHTQIASKGVYYSLEELAEHDALIALRAFQVMQRVSAEPKFNIDQKYHQEFFECVLLRIKSEFNYGSVV